MLRLRVSLSIAAIFAATSATSQTAPAMQGGPQVNEVITLRAFNPQDKTFVAEIRVSADPCPGVAYDVHLNIAGVKDKYAAKDKAREQVAKISNDVQHMAASCGRRKP